MANRVKSFQRNWVVIIVGLVVMLALNAGQSYRAINELVANENRASVTKSALRTVKNLYSSVQDAELGLRGYLLSGNESYLTPYFQSLDQIQANLLELKDYNYESEQQLVRVDLLERMIVERLEEMGRHIQQKKANESSEWLSSIKMMQSHNRMKELRDVIEELEAEEYEHLANQSLVASQSRNDVMRTIVIANSVGLLLVLMVAILVRRALDSQVQESEKLEEMVTSRTAELEHYSDELQRSNRELQDFAFVASHDLQEPLRKIQAFGDRLKSGYSSELGQGADYINRMQKAAARMSRLIEDLLEFSRVSTRANPFQMVDLNGVLQEVIDNLDVKIEESGAKILVETLPEIEADQSQMRQLFQNLLGNAIKFSRENVPPEVRISSESMEPEDGTENPHYLIAVEDNGIGFDEKYIDKIFTPFQRLHGREKYQGTGIGLAICRKIVERHQGELDVTSTPDVGSRFILKLTKYREDTLLNVEREASQSE